MAADSIYHHGELNIQRRAGSTDTAKRAAAMVQATLPERALGFIAQQTLLVIGSMDQDGGIWASLLFGPPGFVSARGVQQLLIDLSEPRTAADDPLWANLKQDAKLGLLLIDLATRRRLRVNGRVARIGAGSVLIDVSQAYPNCPKYIQRRRLKAGALRSDKVDSASPPVTTHGRILSTAQMRLISAADTFFVASAHPDHGLDASHRGGRPGFVRCLSKRRLQIPDFAGNGLFNTLGNFSSYPFAGLVFIDFERGQLLQLSGHSSIEWGCEDAQNLCGGTGRYWQFQVAAWQQSMLPFSLQGQLLDYSPYIPPQTGSKP